MIASVVLMYMLMAALFNSLVYPLVIMLALPVASVGAIGALAITGDTLNIMSLVGMIMLMGLVAKNAILLVDYTNTLRERGYSRLDALLEAGPTRLRPIVMTTAAMVCAMIPVAMKIGEGAEMRAPMAIVVIGGLDHLDPAHPGGGAGRLHRDGRLPEVGGIAALGRRTRDGQTEDAAAARAGKT